MEKRKKMISAGIEPATYRAALQSFIAYFKHTTVRCAFEMIPFIPSLTWE